ncbi:FtsW/RodA/SpoVE family cell cycle protein [Falsiroseomonas selenitidurans]|uniref:Probable peptidoglycan glycosyltransferase FtsW n=1 Tax=Falsiroseomonas selenitidurans TaxID=2716335 RepID=A0ABX1E5E4_9PROT|nr:putative peptidoglycan glycosyltransferase FtsW [Falsiroseomonas selenitidurans]NKC32196.1 cell division protein FtsW [Falsiroseomonas selenitidurans]
MMQVSRADTSTVGRWWWTVDRWTLAALLTLIGFGYVMMLAASPAVAERIGAASRNMFFIRQIAYLALAASVLVLVSMLTVKQVRLLAWIGLGAAMAMVAATLAVGAEIKGARRWIALPGIGSLQPSEFLKPCFAVVAAWLIAEGRLQRRHGATLLALLLFGLIALLLQRQPDIGMLLVVSAVFFAQFFVAGLNMIVVAVAGLLGMAGAVGAYFLFPHVQARVQRFLDPTADNYQAEVALEAFGNGGLLGRGPGEGRIKNVLPDAHADFVFAVAGEEFGLVVCLVILGLFAFVVVRGLVRLLGETDLFVVLACAGLLTQFGLQSFINMASSLHLIPTKGMTLPFVSYGGSSVVAIALGMGMLLALTRRRLSRAEEAR